MIAWWQMLPWPAALMCCCYFSILCIGLYLLASKPKRGWVKRPDVLHRNGQFRDS